uniref:Zinc finger, CCHC-type n=1 Tax=Tanacetum cinerariifolium TaxID=118510 RepID=A0A699GVU2_TANCI|nr:hypothetical protein [Tanacetum cinerariifolium]
MFERENLSGLNYNDWFHSPKMVLRVEKKLFVIEQPISPTSPVDSKQFENSLPYEMLQELKPMFEKQDGVERFDLIQTFYACKHEEGKPCGLIMNGLTSDFAGFVRNYNKHNMGKMISELHALLIEYENGLPKKAATPHVMAIQGGRIQKANKKSLNAKGKGKGKEKGKDKSYIPKPKNPKPFAKEHPTKDDTCDHYKEVEHCKRNYPAYLAELIKKKKQVGTTVSGRAVELEEIQDEDTSPSEITSKITIEVEGFKPPQEEVIPVRRSIRTHQAPEHLCLNVEVDEHSLGDLNEPTNYKATLLDLKFDKWLDAMNAEMNP